MMTATNILLLSSVLIFTIHFLLTAFFLALRLQCFFALDSSSNNNNNNIHGDVDDLMKKSNYSPLSDASIVSDRRFFYARRRPNKMTKSGMEIKLETFSQIARLYYNFIYENNFII